MPSLDLDSNESSYQIRAYQPGSIRINAITYSRSLIVTPEQLIENWAPQTVAEVTAESFQPILELKPDVLLIGTGDKLVFLKPAIYGELINQAIGVEIMDTRAACRTFNALAAENRRVAAALVIW